MFICSYCNQVLVYNVVTANGFKPVPWDSYTFLFQSQKDWLL